MRKAPARWAIAALDQGSSRTRAALFDPHGKILARADAPIQTFSPRPGWIEHDPTEIWKTTQRVLRKIVREAIRLKSPPIALGIANQRSTFLCWDRQSGAPLSPAISWQDRRAGDRLADFARPDFIKKTGLPLTPYYAATKLAAVLRQMKKERRSIKNLVCGTVNTFLIWHLTGGAVHRTDPTNAARMLLYNLDEGDWDDDLLYHFRIPREILPEVAPTQSDFGEAVMDGVRLPITCSIGDQQASLAGLGGLTRGAANVNYGTGGFFLVNTGTRRATVPGLLSSVAWSSEKETTYLVEGTVNGIGPLFTWLRTLGLIRSEKEIDAACAKSRERIFFLPALIGLGAPHWDNTVQTTLFGLTGACRKEDLVRGAVEGIAFLMTDIFTLIQKDKSIPIRKIIASGGGSQIKRLLQMQADLFGKPITVTNDPDSTIRGAALLTDKARDGVNQKYFQVALIKETFFPQIKGTKREALCRRWNQMLTQAQALYRI
ncbi:MAG: glycerol kinase [Nitrospirae bacterium]|nr:glycerol kinase [Candidatus Manganitrophaceae bacterium]